MHNLFRKRKKEEQKEVNIGRPIYLSFLESNPSERTIKEYWQDTNGRIPRFNSWDELYEFLIDNRQTLKVKLEVIKNIEIPNENHYSKAEGKPKPIPDFFWKDPYLDRKVRAACRIKSEQFLSVSPIGKDEIDIWFEKLVKYADEDLFLGLCELAIHPLFILLDSSLLTQSQKETMVRCAINFKKSYTRQEDYHEYTLLQAYESDSFSKEFKDEIYEAIKQNMLKSGNYTDRILPSFFKRFYNDEEVSKEDKITMINYTFPDSQRDDNAERYLFYLGNKEIPSFIQRIVLKHFIEATGYNRTNSHPKTFRDLDSASFINMIINTEISDDLKVKFINLNSNPVMLAYALSDEQIDERTASLLRTKLETLVIPETKEVLEVIKALLSKPDISRKHLVPKHESSKQEN